MNEVIDEQAKNPNRSKTFSILSLVFSFVLLILYFVVPHQFKVSGGLPSPPDYLIYLVYSVYICLVLGLISAILSFYRKEPSTWIKWIGGIFILTIWVVIISIVSYTIWIENSL